MGMPFSKGRKWRKSKTTPKFKKKSSPEPLDQIQSNSAQTILGQREFKAFK
jgi:hypothetical protein